MSETIKKAAAKAKEIQDGVSAAVATARTRTGKPKVTKPEIPPDKEPEPEDKVETKMEPVALIDRFIEHEKGFLAAVDIPDDTGDAMFNAVEAILYHKERISKAELAKKYLEE